MPAAPRRRYYFGFRRHALPLFSFTIFYATALIITPLADVGVVYYAIDYAAMITRRLFRA